jgi:hypothetical protein
LPIDSDTAIAIAIARARARASIEDLRTAFSLSNCEKMHADVIGYSRALLDCGIISDQQWRQLHHQANEALANWRHSPENQPGRLPGWQAKDC